MMKNFLASPLFKSLLHFVLIMSALAVIWFLGPLFGFDGLHPLASVTARVTVMLLVLVLAATLLLKKPLHLLGVACLCLLIWHAGPLLALGTLQPLSTVTARVSVISVILLLYACYGLYCGYQLLRSQADYRDSFFRLNHREKTIDNDEARDAIRSLDTRFSALARQLRALNAPVAAWRRLLEGKRYLYELPWYMIIGNSGAGKTTAVLNSGMSFPALGHASAAQAARAGTIGCDCWLTNSAVWLDTAGLYTSQDGASQSGASEWQGFLGILRRQRSRAPINAAVLAISAQDLLNADSTHRDQLISDLRARLTELRSVLGISFPVYVTVTKMDLLAGFGAFFQSLSAQERAQMLGFTLPYPPPTTASENSGNTDEPAASALLLQLHIELALLATRLDEELQVRLHEVFDAEQRRALTALPQEFVGIGAAVAQLVDALFLDSRFDLTQSQHCLRGVYFTSAAQSRETVVANRLSLMQRVRASLGVRSDGAAGNDSGVQQGRAGADHLATHSYFLNDLFSRLLPQEAHLVKPNLQWEARFRLLRLIGHALVLGVFLLLVSALWVSFSQNRHYLTSVDEKADMLHTLVHNLWSKPAHARAPLAPDVLTTALTLPLLPGLDVRHPALSYRYGLYSGAVQLAAAETSYQQLQDRLLLPQIVRRMEVVLQQAITAADTRTAYHTLRVYLLINDAQRYDGADVKNWVLQDWETADLAAVFGGRASMLEHINQLFSSHRTLQSTFVRDEALVQRARDLLNTETATQRLYERAKQAMTPAAPQDFTLTLAVGPQAGTVFSRHSGKPLDKGIPGLFTYAGYVQLFDQRLPQFVRQAHQDDAWVMGLDGGPAVAGADDDALISEIRRQYLTEYAQQWQLFLEDIHTASGSTLSFDLAVLRAFASPDSPLSRLARAAARETTLTRPLLAQAGDDKSLLGQAENQLNKLDQQASRVTRRLGVRPQERLERELVDNRFAALREVVTGQPDDAAMAAAATAGTPSTALGERPGLDAIAGLLSEYYTVLVVADTSLAANSLPPGAANAGMKLKLEAGKLPAPFQAILSALADSGSSKVTEGTAAILGTQARQQFNRIVAALNDQVGNACRLSIEGLYPFADSRQEVRIEDFTRIFAAGGAADEFFQRQLQAFVDTSQRPWRYHQSDTALATESLTVTAPSVAGELLKLLARQGPDPDAFARMQTIREVFFREPGGKKMAWTMDIEAGDVAPSITELIIDIDGQVQRYSHGPAQTLAVTWPGARGGVRAELTATPRMSAATSSIITSGPWALMRLLDRATLVNTATPGRINARFDFDGRPAVLDIRTGSSLVSPLTTSLLRAFKCPGAR